MNQVSQAQFGMIPLQFIETDPNQPRRTFDENALQELADSIKVSGVIQPILLRTIADSDTRLQLVAGERRYRASQLAGLTEIPGIVRQLTDAEVAIIQLVENHQRAGVPPLEEAEAMDRAMRDHGLKIDDICTEMGVKRRWAYSRLQLLDLCAEARIGLNDGRLAPSTALLIARIPVASLQERAAAEVLTNNGAGSPMTYRQAKTWIEQRYTLDINRAVFSLVDAKLCKAAGSCAECPKRTANDSDKFPDITADVCTDPDCFEMKTEAHNAAEIAKAAKKKIPFYESWEQCKTERNGDLSTGFVLARSFERIINPKHEIVPVDTLLGNDRMPKPVGIFKNQSGNITNIYSKNDIQCALENTGLARTEAQEAALDDEQQDNHSVVAESEKGGTQQDPGKIKPLELQQKIGRAYNEYRLELFDEIKNAISQSNIFAIYRILAKVSFAIVEEYESWALAEKAADIYDFPFDDEKAVGEAMNQASDVDICRTYMDFVLSGYVMVHYSYIVDGEFKEPNDLMRVATSALLQLAILCDVDREAIRKKHLDPVLGHATEDSAPAEEKTGEAPPAGKKKQPARPKQAAKKGAINPADAWPFPKSKDGA